MAIAVSQGPVTGTYSSGTTFDLASWTPGANELCLLAVASRASSITVTAAGNGLTWVEIHTMPDDQSQMRLTVFRALGASPSTGAITVTLSGTPAVNNVPHAKAYSLSGVDTTGTNGSGAVEDTDIANQGGTDNNDPTVTSTPITENAWVVGFISNRVTDDWYTVQADETEIGTKLFTGASGQQLGSKAVRATTPPGAPFALGAADAGSAAREWIYSGLAIKPAADGAPAPAVEGLRLRMLMGVGL